MRGGRPLNWTWHYRRLVVDCGLLAIAVPAEELLREELRQVAGGDAVAKIIVTRGAAQRGYAPGPGTPPTRVVASFPPAAFPASHWREGVKVRRCALILAEQPRLAGAKTLNRLENVLARSEWSDASIAEGLLGDARGNVVEGTMSNVFVVSKSAVATPALARCGVIGAQRERVRELLRTAGFECAERDVRWEELAAADEAFLTNSLIGAWPVASFGERRWKPGPVTTRVQQLLAAEDARA